MSKITAFTTLIMAIVMTLALSAATHTAERDVNPSENGETYIGAAVADAMRARFGADAAIINGGSLGYGEMPAKVTKDTVSSFVPFADDVVIAVKITGSDLLAALEKSVSLLPRRSSSFLQVSGISMTVDLSQPAGKRITSIAINGDPLSTSYRYTVAMTEFLNNGGGGLSSLRKGEQIEKSAPVPIGDILLSNLRYNPAKAASAPGRITLVAK